MRGQILTRKTIGKAGIFVLFALPIAEMVCL